MRKLRFRRRARRDIVEISRYVAHRARSSEAGRKIRDKILQECARIAGFQAILGRQRNELREGLRSVPRRPYIIFFAYPDENSVEIVRVLHGARDLEAVFAEDAE